MLHAQDDVNVLPQLESIQQAASSLKIGLDISSFRGPAELEAIFELMQKQGAQGLLILPGALTWTTRQKITDLALAYRLPSGNFFREAVAAGGLISPGPNYVDMLSQVAKYVHRILKGAKTADLPVEQPTRFETWINLKTAKTLGTASPHTVQTTPTPGPPQVRSGRRDGNLPVGIASPAFARRPVSSGIVALQVRRGGHARCQKARTPVRVTREPDGRQLPVYSVLAIVDLTSLTEATTGWSTRQPARRARRGDATQRETWEAPKRETTRAKFTRQSSHAACAVRRSRLGSMRRGTG